MTLCKTDTTAHWMLIKYNASFLCSTWWQDETALQNPAEDTSEYLGILYEWMRHLYSALLCIVVHPKRFTIIWGGLSSTTTSVQHPLGWCDGSHSTTAPVRSPHTSYRWRGERVIEPIKWMGIIRRPWLTRASGGNLARTPGLHPYSFTMSVMGFLMTTESQDLGLTSHPKDGALLTV